MHPIKQKAFVVTCLVSGVWIASGCSSGQLSETEPELVLVASSLERSHAELYYNPTGDPWVTKKDPASSSISTMLSVGCFRGGYYANHAIDPQQMIFAQKSNSYYVFEECAMLSPDLTGLPFLTHQKAMTSELGARFIGYHSGVLADPKLVGEIDFLDYDALGRPTPKPGYEDYVVWQRDTNGQLDVLRVANGTPILNVTNGDLRVKMGATIAAYLEETGAGGFVWDIGYGVRGAERHNIPLATATDFQGHSITTERRWDEYYIDFLRDVNAAIDARGGNKLLIANVDYVAEPDFVDALLDRTDGVMLEDPFGARDGNDFLNLEPTYNSLVRIAAARNKYFITVANTNVNCPAVVAPGLSNAAYYEQCYVQSLGRQRADHLFYLAAYLTFTAQGSGGNTNVFLHYTPGRYEIGDPDSVGNQFNTSTHFAASDLDIGRPDTTEAPHWQNGRGAYARFYAKARVYWNNSAEDITVDKPNLIAIDGSSAATEPTAVVRARSGMLFVTPEVYADYVATTGAI